MALQQREPEPGLIHHLERRTQYADLGYRQRLLQGNIKLESSKTALKEYASYWRVYVMEVDLGTTKYDSTANVVWRDELSKREDVLRKKKLLPTN